MIVYEIIIGLLGQANKIVNYVKRGSLEDTGKLQWVGL